MCMCVYGYCCCCCCWFFLVSFYFKCAKRQRRMCKIHSIEWILTEILSQLCTDIDDIIIYPIVTNGFQMNVRTVRSAIWTFSTTIQATKRADFWRHKQKIEMKDTYGWTNKQIYVCSISLDQPQILFDLFREGERRETEYHLMCIGFVPKKKKNKNIWRCCVERKIEQLNVHHQNHHHHHWRYIVSGPFCGVFRLSAKLLSVMILQEQETRGTHTHTHTQRQSEIERKRNQPMNKF